MSAKSYIKNPVEWFWNGLVGMAGGTRALRLPPESAELPVVSKIDISDIRQAIALGYGDLLAFRTDALSIAVIYPIAGIVIAYAAGTNDLLPLVFPLISGFALIGPIAAIGLYRLSRRRELNVAGITEAELPQANIGIAIVALLLLAIFVIWQMCAYLIFLATLGPELPQSVFTFAYQVVMTSAGRWMAVIGIAVGFLFALSAFLIGVVSFPLMIDRPVGPMTAIKTSIAAVAKNPVPMAVWSAIVVTGLVIGSAPALIGLVIVIPLLGHSTWHLYRRVISG